MYKNSESKEYTTGVYNLKQYDYDIETWNIIAGKQSNTYSLNDIRNQAKLVAEEAVETNFDATQNDPEGVLDGVCDVLYVTLRLAQQLESMGFDVRGAMQETSMNNMTKFIANNEQAEQRVKDTLKMYGDKGEITFAEYNGKYNCWVIKNDKQKVMKPIGYVKNDLRKYIPEFILKEGFNYVGR